MYLCGKNRFGELSSTTGEYVPLWVLSIVTHILKSSPEVHASQNLPAIASLQLSEAPTTPKSATLLSPPTSKESELRVYFDVGMKEKVTRDGEDIDISGIADYSLGYGKNKTSGNIVIVEAKKPIRLSEAPPECIAYMGLFLRLYAISIMLMNNASDVPSCSPRGR